MGARHHCHCPGLRRSSPAVRLAGVRLGKEADQLKVEPSRSTVGSGPRPGVRFAGLGFKFAPTPTGNLKRALHHDLDSPSHSKSC